MTEQFKLSWPVERPVVNQFFGENPPFYKPFGLPGHEGLDFFAPTNANVMAAADGEVYWVGHPPDHPYGLHVRIKHEVENTVYRTIYAHLAQASVTVGQLVKSGDRIGVADNTGNSFGSHLHLTLKIDGASTPGYPPRIVDPWPHFTDAAQLAREAVELIVYPTELLSLRSESTTTSIRLAILGVDEPLTVLGDSEMARSRVGKHGEWLQVQTEGGLTGFVAAWYVRFTAQTPETSPLLVFPTNLLSVRARPSSDGNRLTTVTPNDALQVLGDPAPARARIGEEGQWLNIRAPTGHIGYVAAWFVRETGIMPPLEPPPGASPILTVYPTVDLNLRAAPSTDSARVGLALLREPLAVLASDLSGVESAVGQEGHWLFVEGQDREQGWAAAWFLSVSPPA